MYMLAVSHYALAVICSTLPSTCDLRYGANVVLMNVVTICIRLIQVIEGIQHMSVYVPCLHT